VRMNREGKVEYVCPDPSWINLDNKITYLSVPFQGTFSWFAPTVDAENIMQAIEIVNKRRLELINSDKWPKEKPMEEN
ncbi:MAG: hypothetical protein KKD77_23685, partial [Gammaproteobacteria bacterium]|nr:hypothetical protein [Gammaproteobacteria bacterium]